MKNKSHIFAFIIVFMLIIIISTLLLIIIRSHYDNNYHIEDFDYNDPSLSFDGRYIAFDSNSLWLKYHTKSILKINQEVNLNNNTTENSNLYNVYDYDFTNHEYECVSITKSEMQGNYDSLFPKISNNGKYILFYSKANDLIDLQRKKLYIDGEFIRDMKAKRTYEVDRGKYDITPNGACSQFLMSKNSIEIAFLGISDIFPALDIRPVDFPYTFIRNISGSHFDYSKGDDRAISDDGRYILLTEEADKIEHNNSKLTELYRFDRKTRKYYLVSKSSNGIPSNHLIEPSFCSISSDGRYIAFSTDATNLVNNITGQINRIYIHDCNTGITSCINQKQNVQLNNNDSGTKFVALSSDGRYIAFDSIETSTIAKNLKHERFIYRYDCQSGKLICVNSDVCRIFNPELNNKPYEMSMSGNGQVFAFSYQNKIYVKDIGKNSTKIIAPYMFP